MHLRRRPEGEPELTPSQRWGGIEFFRGLVEHFYVGVATDPLLRPMYPDDLAESKEYLALFLDQYWGGPRTYEEVRGHPRLRMRHAPFVIDDTAAEAWLRHMVAAVDATELDRSERDTLVDYFVMAAGNLRNARG